MVSMKPDDFYVERRFNGGRSLDVGLLYNLRLGPVEGFEDIEIAVPLARLAHDELQLFGTSGTQTLTNEEIRAALLALRAVVNRLGVTGFDPEFRDFDTFKNHWVRRGASGSGGWQARRNLLAALFEPLHDALADLESRALSSTLAVSVSPHARTGWPAVDQEISELRRHFLMPGARRTTEGSGPTAWPSPKA